MAIVTALIDGRKLATLNISFIDIYEVDPDLLAKTLCNFNNLDIYNLNVIQEHVLVILTIVIQQKMLTKLNIRENDLFRSRSRTAS